MRQHLLAVLTVANGRRAQRKREGPRLGHHGVELGADEALAVLVQVEQTEDRHHQNQDVDEEDAAGQGRTPRRAPRAQALCLGAALPGLGILLFVDLGDPRRKRLTP